MERAVWSVGRKWEVTSVRGGEMGVPTVEVGGDCSMEDVSRAGRESSSGV